MWRDVAGVVAEAGEESRGHDVAGVVGEAGVKAICLCVPGFFSLFFPLHYPHKKIVWFPLGYHCRVVRIYHLVQVLVLDLDPSEVSRGKVTKLGSMPDDSVCVFRALSSSCDMARED